MKLRGQATTARKDQYIETVRGLAILIIVAGHVIGVDSMGGMKVANDSIWRYMYYSFNYLGVSAFTAIAGWVYSIKPANRRHIRQFILKKAIRLLLPMIFVGTLFFLIQYITPGTNMRGDITQIWKIYLLPYTLYWYLPSLFIVFCVIAVIDAFALCRSLRSWSIIMIISLVATFIEPYLSSHYINVFSIWGAVCIMPYFLVGIGIYRFRKRLASPTMKQLYIIGFIISAVLLQLSWHEGDTIAVRELWYSIFLKTISAACLITLTIRNNILIYLGHYAYSIFLFHVFGTSGGRIILNALGIHSWGLIFIFALVL